LICAFSEINTKRQSFGLLLCVSFQKNPANPGEISKKSVSHGAGSTGFSPGSIGAMGKRLMIAMVPFFRVLNREVYHPVKGHHHFPYDGQSVLLHRALVTTPVGAPDAAVVRGPVIASPAFSHMSVSPPFLTVSV